jgi:dienelactone hydrolase
MFRQKAKQALFLIISLVFVAGCSANTDWTSPTAPSNAPQLAPTFGAPAPSAVTETAVADLQSDEAAPVLVPTPTAISLPQEESRATPVASPGQTPAPTFEVGNDLTIGALRAQEIVGSDIIIEETLANGANYAQHIASYLSEGYKVYGLLTVPLGDVPEGGFPAIVFVHGYIPPEIYRTTERYVAYVDALARAGFVVFKIDLRGFGNSEGEPSGAYFSPDYTVDAIAALKSLQRTDYVNPEGIGLWGHSMAGNVVLRAMLAEPDVQAGVIWAGAVYSYDDMVRYAIQDPSFRRDEQTTTIRRGAILRETYGPPDTREPFWQAVSLTENIEFLEAPLQIHHALNDSVVNIGYSQDLAAVLEEAGKSYQLFTYDGGGHNIESPYFGDAMQQTIQFFRDHL